jgi:hypothetical protein
MHTIMWERKVIKKEISEIMSKEPLSISEFVHLSVLLRKFIERENLKSELPTLNLYLNLLVHILIDKSADADEIIISINESMFPWISKLNNLSNAEEMKNAIIHSLLLKKFISNFKEVIEQMEIKIPKNFDGKILTLYLESIIDNEVSIRKKDTIKKRLEKLSPRSFIPKEGMPEEKMYIHTYKFTRNVNIYSNKIYLECYGLSTNQVRFQIPLGLV